jgi:predicted house-cleaning noncanonical NTP pyrophosphatase (MazG superfamily)
MPKITYNKLIRDHIPAMIAASGKTCKTEIMSPDEFEHRLLEKLVEEAREAQQAEPAQLKTELADLLEVIEALLAARGISRQAVRQEQRCRRKERGGFAKRLKLLWTESVDE